MKNTSLAWMAYIYFFLVFTPSFLSAQLVTEEGLDTMAISSMATAMQLEGHYRKLAVSDEHGNLTANDKFFEFKATDSKLFNFCKLVNVDTSHQKVEVVWGRFIDSIVVHVVLKSTGLNAHWEYHYSETNQRWSLLKRSITGTIKKDDRIFSISTNLELLRIYDEWLLKLMKHATFTTNENEGVLNATLTFEKRVVSDTIQHQFKIICQKSTVKEVSVTTILYLDAKKNRTTDTAFHIKKYYVFLADGQSILEAKFALVEDATKAKRIPVSLLLEILLNPTLPN